MCSWDKYCSFAREPERKPVDSNARISVEGSEYAVAADLAGQTVILWWGLFDNELFVEHEGKKYGPYSQVSGPIPLHKYRKFKKTKSEERADRIEELANQLGLPRAAVTGEPELAKAVEHTKPSRPTVPFPAASQSEAVFPNAILAKLAIAHYFGKKLGNLPQDDCSFIAEVLEKTLNKQEVMASVKAYFARKRQKRR
jgi:3'-phosphoadenosine 5'-phosphosulfate sulfotransferase